MGTKKVDYKEENFIFKSQDLLNKIQMEFIWAGKKNSNIVLYVMNTKKGGLKNIDNKALR